MVIGTTHDTADIPIIILDITPILGITDLLTIMGDIIRNIMHNLTIHRGITVPTTTILGITDIDIMGDTRSAMDTGILITLVTPLARATGGLALVRGEVVGRRLRNSHVGGYQIL
jgi:phage terminase large subunit-like protein